MSYKQMNDWQGRRIELESWAPGVRRSCLSGLGPSVFGSGRRRRGTCNFLTLFWLYLSHSSCLRKHFWTAAQSVIRKILQCSLIPSCFKERLPQNPKMQRLEKNGQKRSVLMFQGLHVLPNGAHSSMATPSSPSSSQVLPTCLPQMYIQHFDFFFLCEDWPLALCRML